MANFNSVPTEGNSANNGGHNPESSSNTDDTTQLPKLDEHANGFNGNGTSDALPTTNQEQNSPEDNNPEHKSHLGRNLVISGVAAVALAACIGIFNGSGDSSGSIPDTDNTPVAEETTDSNNIAIPAPTIETPSNEGKSWIDIIGEEQRDEDDILLTTQQIADYIGSAPEKLATDYAYDVCTCLEEWAEFNNMDVINCEVGQFQGNEIPMLSAYFYMNDNSVGVLTAAVGIDGNFILQVRTTSGDGEPYRFTSESIPSIDELENIMTSHVIYQSSPILSSLFISP